MLWRSVLLFLSLASSAAAQMIDNCPVFPVNNVWNARVDSLPVHANSAAYVNRIGLTSPGHSDFGSGLWDGGPIGIPFTTVPGNQAKVPITFQYSDESDPGPYPIPANAPIEGGAQSSGDRHVLVIDRDNCVLYEVYSAYPQTDGSWSAGSGAVFDLKSNKLRPSTWTSADAAGLPMFPGLVRYDEVAAGEIRHALRFTAPRTQKAFIWPARHQASSLTDTTYPPMGQRFRLKANFDISGYAPEMQVILRALQRYGMILADNGSSWYISGAPDDRWNNDDLSQMRNLNGTDFEAVDESSLMLDPNSGVVAFTDMPFVRQLYLDLLDRDADTAGLAYWSGALANGSQTRSQAAAAFFTSPEFSTNGLYIIKLYFAVFNRDPDFTGWWFWFTSVHSGTPAATALNSFLNSPEFQSVYGTLDNPSFVTQMYRNIMGRDPDPAGQSYYVALLNGGGFTRADMVDQFVRSSEYDARVRPRAYANLLYMGFLCRTADSSGLTFWTNTLTDPNALPGAIGSFITGTEYLNRFAQ